MNRYFEGKKKSITSLMATILQNTSHLSGHDRNKQNWGKVLSKIRKTEEMLFLRIVTFFFFKIAKVLYQKEM